MLETNNLDSSNLTESVGLYSQIENTSRNVKDNILSTDFGFKNLANNVSIFDDKLIKASRSLGQGVIAAKSLEQNFAKVSENIIKIGGDADDVIQIFKDMTSSLERTVYFSDKALFNMALLKKVGVADDTIKSFNKLFDTIGGTFEEATTQQMMLVNQAKSYGLNVTQFMSAVAGQLTKINQYGFPNGVKDLGEMVSRSKMLGMNMETAMSFADRIMSSPETAMDVAAQLQTLGGSFASLGDPMELLYLAQNDLSGLNDKLINATRGLATFNKETGQFEIGVNERLRIKQVATQFGMDANSMIETSLRLAKQEEVLKRINFSDSIKTLKPEEQRILASFAQLGKDGKVTLEGKELGTLTSGDVENLLKKLQGAGSELITGGQDAQTKNIEMIQQNSSALENAIMSQTALNNAISLTTIQTGKLNTVLDKAGNIYSGILDATSDFKTKFAKKLEEIISGEKGVTASASGEILTKINETLSLIGNAKQLQKLTLETAKPIEITLNSSFNITDVVKNALATAVNERIAAEVQAQLDKRATPSGTVNRYSTSTTSGG